jgi:transcription-repair coupling factor (superfamily II helicase)
MSDLTLWDPLLRAPFFVDLGRRLDQGEKGLSVTGLTEGARALVLGLLAASRGQRLALVLPDDTAVAAYLRDAAALAGLMGLNAKRIVALPALDADPYDDIPPHPEVARERVVAVERLLKDDVDLLLVPVRALLQPLPAPDDWSSWVRTIKKDQTLAPDRFVLEALGLGYRRVDTVSSPGEVSRRGGILDVFPPSAPEPVRIELFGDAVESIRSFDTDHQRSTGILDEIVIGPAVENPPTEQALWRLSAYLESSRDRAAASAAQEFRRRLDQLKDAGYWPGLESLASLMAFKPVSVLDHANRLVLVVDDPERVDDELTRALHELQSSYQQRGDRVLPPPEELFIDAVEIRKVLAEPTLVLEELSGMESAGRRVTYDVACRSARSYDGRVKELAQDLGAARANSVRTVCVMRAPGSADRLMEIFNEYELFGVRLPAGSTSEDDGWKPGGLFVGLGALRAGFEFPGLGLVALCERELFGEERKASDRKTSGRAAFISDFRDVKRGDTVVHVDHGVARYGGLGRPKGGSLNRDFMVLEFAGNDRLFVPVDRLDLVQRYNGVGRRPQLDRLGGPGWERTKAKVRKSVRNMAKELLDLYARREAARGHAFSEDSPWQRELEASFPYELTPDQERTVTEVKHEMESDRPMDRLLVGDVGFGKTEVGVRAAFKAVMDGFQVAVLAPTTVLAMQHLETFSARCAPFPVRIEMVSRFRTAAEIKRVLLDLELGTVDVLIGTHRMLSKDVRFKNLGLLIVDEEQRFGVAHKERLKTMSLGIDVLSMTATPIPRTLQMSLGGVRDMSVIETPPPGRMAIQTYLVPFRKNALAQAIRHELRRKGQVFVVQNRIETLPALARAVKEMVPEARVVIAHGQMRERALEKVMRQFVHDEADILVTTTIIENGLDIPRANTIIVNRADRLGLAQLYQLRGRVGRSQVHAYAYFIIPGRQSLSEDARKRLKALQEFSELGAGFRLAAADLEIRGAGELLGSKQHGHIAAIGFDLYCQMLERAVQDLQGEPVKVWQPPSLHLGVDVKVPQSYLPDSGNRLSLYKRLALARQAADVDRLQAETEDRFGHLPSAARSLFEMAQLRLLAERVGVKSVNVADDKLQIRFHQRPPIEPLRIVEMLARERGSLTPSGMMLLPAPPRGLDRIHSVTMLLQKMAGRSVA